jgi:hypothetical protein
MLEVLIPVKTISVANVREHWRARARRTKEHRQAAKAMLAGARDVPLPVIVTMTRYAPSSGLDGDNLQGALKAVRDGIADAFGLDDRDMLLEWRYDQQRSKKGFYAVLVKVETCTYES